MKPRVCASKSRVPRAARAGRAIMQLMVAGLAATTLLSGGCASLPGMLSLSNDQVLSRIPSQVRRVKLKELSPEVAAYLESACDSGCADAYVTIVDDLLLRDLFAKARVLANASASFWDARAVVDSHVPSLTGEIVYRLSGGEDSLLLVSESFADSTGKREQLILVHESAHKDQFEQERYVRKGAGRIVANAPSMKDYLADPRETEAYKWEIRYARFRLGMDLGSYLNVRIGFIVDPHFAEAMAALWHEVEQEPPAMNRSSAPAARAQSISTTQRVTVPVALAHCLPRASSKALYSPASHML